MDGAPKLVVEAYECLINSGLVEVSRPLKLADTGGYDFHFKTTVAQPNPEELPRVVEFRVVIPSAFPFKPVDVFALSSEVCGFPHQDAETQKLCLKEERKAPCTTERLTIYIQWVLEWLEDAAHRHLLTNADPYELPDFSTKRLKKKPPLTKTVWFIENSASFAYWQNRIGQTGSVEIVQLKTPDVLFTRLFKSADGSTWKPHISPTFSVNGERLPAAWILLPSLAYHRNRPPQTFAELCAMCDSLSVNLMGLFRSLCLGNESVHPCSVLLIGAPIPTVVGGRPNEIHWQPLFIKTVYGEPGDIGHKYGKQKREKLWRTRDMEFNLQGEDYLPWAVSVNVSEERLLSRGAITDALRDSKLVLVGCGALGSVLAEQFIRGGARDIALIDKEAFEPGNHARHTADGNHFGLPKATALRMRLQPGSPYCRLRDHVVSIPSFDSEPAKLALSDLEQADVILDCSTNESAFQWLSNFAAGRRKRFAHIFISFGARFLTLVLSGKRTSSRLALRSFCKIAQNGAISTITPAEMDDYFRDPEKMELIIPGAGCWHATFPARWNHIESLVGVAFDVLEEFLSAPEKSGGTVVVFRRTETSENISGRVARIEEIHRGLYR